MRFALCFIILFASAFSLPMRAAAEKVTDVVSFSDSRSLETTLWYPDNVELIRGAVVFTGGQGSGGSNDTRAIADNPFWRAFAESLGFAIVGTRFTGAYTDASSGPGTALTDALASYAMKTGHSELQHAPLLLQGFSNGGYFSFTFAAFQPDRVIAFCLNKSGFARAALTDAFLAVPGLLIWGSEEPATGVPTVIHSLVQQGRQKHALWAELKEWGRAHEEGSVERVFAPFFADMVALRYPTAADPRLGPVSLHALRESDGYLADHTDASIETNVPTIATYAAYGGDKLAASWLPSAGLATLWRGFVTKNPLTLNTPGAGQLIDASQPLQLSAAGYAGADTASFLDGAAPLLKGVSANGGSAKGSWTAKWGGVRGIVAVAVDASGKVTHTSRPSHVVLQGKDAPVVLQPVAMAMPVAPPIAKADAGVDSDAGSSPAMDSRDAGNRSDAGSLPVDQAGGGSAHIPHNPIPALGEDRTALEGGCQLGARARHAQSPLWLAAGLAAWWRWRRRARVTHHACAAP